MMDFELGLKNAIKKALDLSDKNIAGCYFHFVKAIISKARKLGVLVRKKDDPVPKILIGLLKILSHCPLNERENLFNEIEKIYKDKGKKYEVFLNYFRKNWLRNAFLESLFEAYKENSNINFIRTNNPCELLNKYLGTLIFILKITNQGKFFNTKSLGQVILLKNSKKLNLNSVAIICSSAKVKRKSKNQKSNFDKNPLENISLPYKKILRAV